MSRWTNGPSGLRCRDTELQRDGEPVSLRALAQLYKSRSAEWDWLRAQGYERPRMGGSRGAESTRETVAVLVRLSPEDAATLRALAAGGDGGVSGWISRQIRKSTDL